MSRPIRSWAAALGSAILALSMAVSLVGIVPPSSAARAATGERTSANEPSVQPAEAWAVEPIKTLNAFEIGGGLAFTGRNSGALVFNDGDRIYVTRTSSGGATWSAASRVASPGIYAPFAIASRGQTIDLAYAFQGGSYDEIRYRRTVDGGKSWTKTKILTFGRLADLAIARGPNGLVAIVAWVGDTLNARVSTNGGASFGRIATLATFQPPSTADYTTGDAAVAIAGNTIVVSYWRSPSVLQVRRSTNGGHSWSPVQKIAKNQQEGYNARNLLSAHGQDVVAVYASASTSRIRVSHDHGVTWGAPIPLEATADETVALGFSGGAWRLAWGGTDGAKYRESSDGRTWSTAETIASRPDYEYLPLSVGVLGGARAVALDVHSGDASTLSLATKP